MPFGVPFSMPLGSGHKVSTRGEWRIFPKIEKKFAPPRHVRKLFEPSPLFKAKNFPTFPSSRKILKRPPPHSKKNPTGLFVYKLDQTCWHMKLDLKHCFLGYRASQFDLLYCLTFPVLFLGHCVVVRKFWIFDPLIQLKPLCFKLNFLKI